MSWILLIAITILLVLCFVIWFFNCNNTQLNNGYEAFTTCSVPSETLNEITTFYASPNEIPQNVQLSNGLIYRGPLLSENTSNLGLYSSLSEDQLNIYTNGGPIVFSTNNGQGNNVVMTSTGELNAFGGVHSPNICLGVPGNAQCFSLAGSGEVLTFRKIKPTTLNVSGTITSPGVFTGTNVNSTGIAKGSNLQASNVICSDLYATNVTSQEF